MSFQPILPFGGFAGWRFLERTLPAQSATHARAPAAQRLETHFRENIGKITSAEALVKDRRLLEVALTAFGLAEDLPNRAFIQRVLESPADEPRSFVNRLADKRYGTLAAAFGFGEAQGPRTTEAGFADRVLEQFRARRFEADVGTQNDSMRLALALRRDLAALAERDISKEAGWFTVLGTPSLRRVFETAYGLPQAFGTQDIDRQAEVLRRQTERAFGSDSLSQFTDPAVMNQLIRRFFVGEQISQIAQVSAQSSALSLLISGQESFARFRVETRMR
jgi:hypothetical protein